ncbi:MAG: sigma-54 dependent transcriptional regulator [Pirellulaceae bacterium]|nr:sigma-54 dependent transcriptional regulator [Pirellulaceae bacterium]
MKILFADDEPFLQDLMRTEIPRMGHQVTVCPDGLAALAALEKDSYDCLIVDLDMPGMNGIDLIESVKERAADTDAVVLTGKSSFESAVRALRAGAFDYLTKPCKLVRLQTLLTKIKEKRELNDKYKAAKYQLERAEGKTEIVGQSEKIRFVKKMVQKVAPTEAAILIRGETGTGKELVARSLHEHSTQREMPFVAVNCGALPESLIESELFGHRKGAFTGADNHRKGLFEMANGGTIFLDEIGELPKNVQAKLLRVLESKEIRRVGDSESRQIEVRIVCATHRNLEEMVVAGEFREDLMFRINTFEIFIPPLRERSEDITLLADHLGRRILPRRSPDEPLFTDDAVDVLGKHTWPGNVRELANAVEHAAILCDDLPVGVNDLPHSVLSRRESYRGGVSLLEPMTLKELEFQAIKQSLERLEGNKPAVAEELGVSLKTLYNKINQYAQLKEVA